jgi:hypothetical protein
MISAVGLASARKTSRQPGMLSSRQKKMRGFFYDKKTAFVWNATTITRQLRSQFIALFTAYGAQVKIVYLEVLQPDEAYSVEYRVVDR